MNNVTWRDVVSGFAAILLCVIALLWSSRDKAIDDLKASQTSNKAELQQQVSALQTQGATTSGEVQALKARVDNVEKGNDRIEKNTQRLLEILGERRK